jgi:hypothetical protein
MWKIFQNRSPITGEICTYILRIIFAISQPSRYEKNYNGNSFKRFMYCSTLFKYLLETTLHIFNFPGYNSFELGIVF